MSESCCSGERPQPAARAAVAPPAARNSLWRLGVSGAAILSGALAGILGLGPLSRACYIAAIALAIVPAATRAVRSIRIRALDINVLMVVAVFGAMVLGDWTEAATVIWLFGAAQWLESFSMARARRAIRSLLDVTPSRARVRRDGTDETVEVGTIQIGEIVIVRPGERLPVDGVVLRGTSAINQAPITGEAFPVDKAPGSDVFAGSVNGTGALEVRATRAAADSTVGQIARLVEEAQRRRAPIQTFVDRFARIYTPIVVSAAVVLAVIPPLMTGGGAASYATWLYRALTLLVVACPCALVISTPVSIVSALTAAARAGVLIKGGESLERLGGIRCVAIDKTGTLTHGEVSVTDVFGVDGMSAHRVLSVAAALESQSEHPIGRAIVTRALDHGIAVTASEGYQALPGFGAEAIVGQAPAIVGSHRLFEERRLCTPSLHDQLDRVTGLGGTAVLVGHGGAAVGVIGLIDRAREGAREAISRLRHHGVVRVVLLSGDSRSVVSITGAAHEIDEAHAELLPADKAAMILRLRETYGPTAMVGDGINDAPALAAADVGIAMGGGGTDVAIETADVALMSDDLAKVPYALGLARATMTNIRTNVALALGMKVAFAVLAATGLATLWMAVLADTGASLLVTANGLRLLRPRN